MRVVIHAGMHKTGSSSIQEYFWNSKDENLAYARWTGSNHCGLFVLLFEDADRLARYHGFKARGADFISALPRMKERWLESLKEDLTQNEGKTLVFSAEDISAPEFRNAVVRMRDFFKSYATQIEVVGYVRSPLSFAVSAFQQMLKDGGMSKLQVEALWPHYRSRFEMLEEIFGIDNVTLRIYDLAHFEGGDIVRDFASILGVGVREALPAHVNASLSAEATALLFVQRRLGDGYLSGFMGAQAGNNSFVDKLRTIGEGKMTFSEEIWNPVLERHADDLKWIENRLGRKLDQVYPVESFKVGSESDLIQLALQSYDALEDLLFDSIRTSSRPPVQRLARALDLLRKFSY